MEIFQDSLAASLAVGLLVGFVSAAPTWWALGQAKISPALRRLVTGLDFAVFCLGTAYVLHSGLLA